MRIAITGAHGTGKTTLANALAEKLGLPLITESARQEARERGIESVEQLKRNKELAREFQWGVLRRQVAAEQEHPNGFVSDRSRVDCLAYWAVYNLPGDETYLRTCFDSEYDVMVYVPPEIPCEADGFRDTDEDTRKNVDKFIRAMGGVLCDMKGFKFIGVSGTLEERVKRVVEAVENDY
jgi:nicotinamide riboside kinase